MSDKTMDKIQALLNQANDVGLDSAEGKLFLAKAQELKHKHDIDDIMLRIRSENIAERDAKRKTVTAEWIDVVPITDEFLDSYTDMAVHLASLCDVMLVRGHDWATGMMQLHVVGYPKDIQYFRMLLVSCQIAFSAKLFPEWDAGKSAGHNIRMLAESGIKWGTIYERARAAGDPLMRRKRGGNGEMEEVPPPPNDGGFMKREMGKAYAAEGLEKPKLRHGVQNYRDSFAAGFVGALSSSISKMRMEKRRAENAAGDGVSLVLSSDANAVKDYFESLYPPGSLSAGRATRKMKAGYGAAAERGAAAGRSVDLKGGAGGVSSGTVRQGIGR